ncbi:MAG: signal peptidase I [Gammaproteobacteria bacterium]|nr:signal peptidase I [Gammaproteobacteria bacterium]MCW9030069.1 signal peptidase I [Gammaproteobacteria bacterium]
MSSKIPDFWKNNRYLILFISLMVLFRTSIADWNTVPTGSMKPTILEGDRLWVNKIAYDLKLPFTGITLKNFASPERGDIIIFESEKAGKRLVKRVMGLPGDTVSMNNNIISLNGKTLEYKILSQRASTLIAEERHKNINYHIQLNQFSNNNSSFYNVKIPDNYYLVLGDNRDNSADSRYIGLIPRSEIIGRTQHVVMSLNYENYYLPRPNRFFHRL